MRILQSAGLALLLFLSINSNAQSFEVPKGYDFKSPEDYARYEKDIIEAAKWLKATPFNQEADKRKDVSAFVVVWLTGSSNVSVTLESWLLDFEKKNDGMMVLFMASYSKWVLENSYSKDAVAAKKAALKDMMDVYKAGVGIKKDKKMENMIKANDENKLDEWIEKNLKAK